MFATLRKMPIQIKFLQEKNKFTAYYQSFYYSFFQSLLVISQSVF